MKAKFILVVTSEATWAKDNNGEVFLLNTPQDFTANGLQYADYMDLQVGEMIDDNDYEGVYVMRVA
jgi:hypothetical protein